MPKRKTLLNIMLECPWTMLSYIQWWTRYLLKPSLKRFWFATDRIVLDEFATHFVFLFVFLVFSLNAEAEEQ